jgi:hypothetical protein
MKRSELKKLIKEAVREVIDMPHDWEKGFHHPYKVPQGEQPFQVGGRWYLYVWDGREKDHVVYDFSSDMFIPYGEFQANYLREASKKKKGNNPKDFDAYKRHLMNKGARTQSTIPPKKGKGSKYKRDKGIPDY